MNLLITGGAGFIGSHVIRSWMDKPEVAKLVNLDGLTYAADLARLDGIHDQHPRYVFEKADLRDAAPVRGIIERHEITHVVHLAAETHVDRSITGPGDFLHTNVLGTFHLLEACRAEWNFKSQISNLKFLHVSTDEVYGSLGPDDPAFTEESPLLPNSPYSASKAAADHLVRSYVHTYGFPAIITRSVNNFGPGQHEEKLIPTVLRCLAERRPIPIYGDGLNIREWLPVNDHADALWRVLCAGKSGTVYNIGAGHELTNLDLIGRLCDLHDEAHQHPGGESRQLISFVTDRPGHDRRYAVNSARIRTELAWQPMQNFETALRAICSSSTLEFKL